MTTSKGGIHLVGAAALIAQAEQRGARAAGQSSGDLTKDKIRVETCKIMIKQFRDQCEAVEKGDPARAVVEMMLDSFEKVLTQ